MRLLDLFCCAGGAAKGYMDAGFEVIGVDITTHPRYPGSMLVEMDAIEALTGGLNLDSFDAIHASPPCQGETVLQYVNNNREAHPRLIREVRELLQRQPLPYIIENVIGADLYNPVTLCGEMFGLGVIRHRLFETDWNLEQPAHVKHRGKVRGWRHGKYSDGPYVAVYGQGGGKATLAEASEAMGIDWMTYDEIVEAIPPAFTEYVGKQLMAHLQSEVAA